MDGITFSYKKLINFLDIASKPDLGLTLVISPNWMFMTTIVGPYHIDNSVNIPGAELESGLPVYLDGFAYCGIINL